MFFSHPKLRKKFAGSQRVAFGPKTEQGDLAQVPRKSQFSDGAGAAPLHAPAELSKRASEIFGLIVARAESIGTASIAFTETFADLAREMEHIEKLDEHIREYGAVYAKIELIDVPGENGKTVTKAQKLWKANPAVAQRAEAFRPVQSLRAEIGLSPLAIEKASKCSSKNAPEEDDPWGAIANQ